MQMHTSLLRTGKKLTRTSGWETLCWGEERSWRRPTYQHSENDKWKCIWMWISIRYKNEITGKQSRKLLKNAKHNNLLKTKRILRKKI